MIFVFSKISKNSHKSFKKYAGSKKERLAVVKNLINNLKFIKTIALENYYFFVSRLARVSELKDAKSLDNYNSLKQILFCSNKCIMYIVFILIFNLLKDSDEVTVGSVAVTVYLLDVYSTLLVGWEKFLKFSAKFIEKEKLFDQY